MADFVAWYNHEHHHTGIGLHTPADVHYALAAGKAKKRIQTLNTARAAHPERFAKTTTPKILQLPEAAWINQPSQPTDQTPDTPAA